MKGKMKYEEVVSEEMTGTSAFLKFLFGRFLVLFVCFVSWGFLLLLFYQDTVCVSDKGLKVPSNLNRKNKSVLPLANQCISPIEMPQCNLPFGFICNFSAYFAALLLQIPQPAFHPLPPLPSPVHSLG